MKKLFFLLLLPLEIIFPQTNSELFGYWMLDSNTELIKITKDSITINSGFFMEGKKDTINKEIIVNDNVTNYEMLNNKIILTTYLYNIEFNLFVKNFSF